MEVLAEAPPLAIIAFGATLALIFGVRFLGVFAGSHAGPEKARAAAQVATVIVDPTALNKATVAMETHTLAVNRMVNVGEDLAKAAAEVAGAAHGMGEAVKSLSKVIATAAEEVDGLREEIRIQHEVSRR